MKPATRAGLVVGTVLVAIGFAAFVWSGDATRVDAMGAGEPALRQTSSVDADGSGSQAPPNIVFILIDDLGWRDVGFMGSEYYETPNIDRLAAEGMVFTNAYANGPNCAPSRASLLSGQYTPRHGIYTVAPSNRGDPAQRKFQVRETETRMSHGIVTIAEILRERGYATASLGKWHLGGEGHLPTDQGFDINVAGNSWGMPQSYFWPYERRRGDEVVGIPGLRAGGAEGEYLTDRLTEEAVEWMERSAGRPFFLYLSHYAVHTPIEPKPELVARYRAKEGRNGHDDPRYAAMIESVDDSVAVVMRTLERLGIADDTFVVFFSDNGGLGTVTSMEPLRGSKGMLYEGGIREPLIVRWPGRTVPGTVSDVPVIGTDFYPTLLEVAGAAPPDQPLDGLSLVPLLDDAGTERSPAAQPFAERPLHWHFPAYLEAGPMIGPWRTTPVAAVRRGDFKLIEFFEDGRLELYDLAADPGEQRDVSEAMPAMTAELHELMRSWRTSIGAYVPAELNPEYDPGR